MIPILLWRKASSPWAAEFTTETGHLPATEWDGVVVDERIVDPHHAGLQRFVRTHRLIHTRGEYAGAEARTLIRSRG